MTDIYVDVDGNRMKLEGDQLHAQIQHSAKLQQALSAQIAQSEANAAAFESASNKLSALGLTEAEIKALVG